MARQATFGALAAALMLVAAACNGGDRGGMADTTAMTSPPAAADSATSTAGAAGTLTDANIIYILDQANIADSARGTLAQTKGSAADVKRFGALMAGDHHGLRVSGAELATKLGVTPQAPADDQSEVRARAEMDSLTAMPKGEAWDRAYIDYEVSYHRSVIETANRALAAAQSAELKELIRTATPIFQNHLQRAQQIQESLGS